MHFQAAPGPAVARAALGLHADVADLPRVAAGPVIEQVPHEDGPPVAVGYGEIEEILHILAGPIELFRQGAGLAVVVDEGGRAKGRLQGRPHGHVPHPGKAGLHPHACARVRQAGDGGPNGPGLKAGVGVQHGLGRLPDMGEHRFPRGHVPPGIAGCVQYPPLAVHQARHVFGAADVNG